MPAASGWSGVDDPDGQANADGVGRGGATGRPSDGAIERTEANEPNAAGASPPRGAPSPTAQITFLYVRDLEIAGRFYDDVLGLPLVLDQGGCLVFQVAPNAYQGVCERPAIVAAGPPRGAIVTFVVDDAEAVDAWHARLVARGVEPRHPPRDNPEYGIHHFFLQDPDGHTLEVQSFADPEWSTPV